MNLVIKIVLVCLCLTGCRTQSIVEPSNEKMPFTWDNATIYFLMTDRFFNGDKSNDYVHTLDNEPAPYRGYMGGDIKGITKKIKDNYFSNLGVNAIWLTPVVEQIEGSVNEGTGNSFGFHGYWTKDWTAIAPNLGTEADIHELISTAHSKGIRILFDVVANHTGPVTTLDPVWPDDWVKTGPKCTYTSAESTINCTLVENLPDIRTESQLEVELPEYLTSKWKKEGRYTKEIQELDDWFEMTKYRRTPVNYILKWLVDFIDEYGIDGFRVDTVKHTESEVWGRLWKQAQIAHKKWKRNNPSAVLDNNDFYMVGEVYNFYANNGRLFDYGDKKVDFFADGFHSLVNFDFKSDAKKSYHEIFSKYDELLHNEFKGKSLVHYISSHDDSGPYDKERNDPFDAGTKLLLSPGAVQIYYGDESARSLSVAADGDATLRSFMNWDELLGMKRKNGYVVNDVLVHWLKLGKFRNEHPAIGAGKHEVVSQKPYLFTRSWTAPNGKKDRVMVGVDMPKGQMVINVSVFAEDGETIIDRYSGISQMVIDGKVTIDSSSDVVLFEKVIKL